MRMSEDFYDLCGELAEAEDALARVPQSARQPEERQREWQELIDCLANEIGQACRARSVEAGSGEPREATAR